MKRKLLVKIGCSLATLCMASCGEPEQKFEITVTDEYGAPMKGVECKAWLNRRGKTSPLDTYVVRAVTDFQGVAELQGETVWYQTAVAAEAPGYYRSSAGDHWTEKRHGNRWEPWPVKVDLILKKKDRPHAMYAFRAGPGVEIKQFWFPSQGAGEFGFDLTALDWVKPHGKGEIADFVLSTEKGKIEGSGGRIPRGQLKLSFSEPDDGIIAAVGSARGGAFLSSPREASAEGYLKEYMFSNSPFEDGLFEETEPKRRVWVFRVRTKVDQEGHVVSARYGKIVGHPEVIHFKKGPAFRICFYLNGKDNDRNLEWDLRNNLFKDLSRGNWPKSP